jgi:hypothetical protein
MHINKVYEMSDLQSTHVVGYAGRYCCQSSTTTMYESPSTGPNIPITTTLIRTGARPPAVRHTQNYKRPHPVHHCPQTNTTIVLTLL